MLTPSLILHNCKSGDRGTGSCIRSQLHSCQLAHDFGTVLNNIAHASNLLNCTFLQDFNHDCVYQLVETMHALFLSGRHANILSFFSIP